MTPFWWPSKAKNCEFHCPKSIVHILSRVQFQKKERGVAIVVYVRHGYRSKFPSTHGHTHTTTATPLQLSVEIAVCSRCELLIWAAFLFFLQGLMRVIIIFGTSKLFFEDVEFV